MSIYPCFATANVNHKKKKSYIAEPYEYSSHLCSLSAITFLCVCSKPSFTLGLPNILRKIKSHVICQSWETCLSHSHFYQGDPEDVSKLVLMFCQ